MKKYILIFIVISFSCLSITHAEKPQWAGKSKDVKEEMKSQKSALRERYGASDSGDNDSDENERYKKDMKSHKSGIEERYGNSDSGDNDSDENEKYKKVKKDEDLKGLEKQRERKTFQEQKESDKGSEKGQESRLKRKKWWKFWE